MKRILAVTTFVVLTLSLASAQRLPETARPENYKLKFTPDLEKATFEGPVRQSVAAYGAFGIEEQAVLPPEARKPYSPAASGARGTIPPIRRLRT